VEILETLKAKLFAAILKVESLVKKASPDPGGNQLAVKRWKYVLIRESLNVAISEFEKWQQIFDPTWFLIILVKDGLIDSELVKGSTVAGDGAYTSSSSIATVHKLRGFINGDSSIDTHINLREDGLDWDSARRIAYSTTRAIQRIGSEKVYLVDSISCDAGLDIAHARADAEALAKRLKQVEPSTCCLLSCHGIVKRRSQATKCISSINLVFRLPDYTVLPVSLRQFLLRRPTASLTTVLEVARQLAMAVSFIHSCEFVHKNIRPETVLLLQNSASSGIQDWAGGKAYLLGFDRFRGVNVHTVRRGDDAWERNLYRHPLRQGLLAEKDYVMQHDVYSLGVCLLELGLWESFVMYTGDDDGVAGLQAQNSIPSLALGLSLNDFNFTKSDSTQAAASIKHHLIQLAESKLPQRMGDKYTSVVKTCLTCLDVGNEDFGDEAVMLDDDGILVGVRFIEKILLRLAEISL
jgi:hypothetical protein